MDKTTWLEKNGFNTDKELTFCVVGDNTYAIKDHLKAEGFKYSPLLGWHGGNQIEIPVGYTYVTFTFDEIYVWEEDNSIAAFKENVEYFVKKRIRSFLPKSNSEYVGEIGERLVDITAILKSKKGFYGAFGWTNLYSFESNENILVWFTQKELNIEEGQPVLLRGTVKKHEEYREVKTTTLTRCIVKVIETNEEVEEEM